ncbi:MAG: DUF3781 domain-containing protein [Rickettsiales bacterium]|jgi:hypothetical protein|nr:DUF3781 domain-containing protein [Rickettsiales bacterium]
MENIPIESLHTTMLGEKRIKHNLGLEINDVVSWCKSAISDTNKGTFIRKGKNWYVYGDDYVLTINAIITTHKLVKKM